MTLHPDLNSATVLIVDNDGSTPNLLRDPGFEDGREAWLSADPSIGSVVSDEAKRGDHSLQIASRKGQRVDLFQEIAVQPQREYLMKSYTQFDLHYQEEPVMEIIWLDGADREISRTPLLIMDFPLGKKWRYFSACITSPADAVTAHFRLNVVDRNDEGGTAWFDELGFYEGESISDVGRQESAPERVDLR